MFKILKTPLFLSILRPCLGMVCLLVTTPVCVQAQRTEASPAALSYFNDAFDYIQRNFYDRKKVNFNQVRKDALTKMQGAVQPSDTHDAIRYVISTLGDKHSRFYIPKRFATTNTAIAPSMPFAATTVNSTFGAIELYSYSSLSRQANLNLADSLFRTLLDFAKKGMQGVVIDLRKMEGGSADPFLCGLSPLIGNAKLFTFEGRHQEDEVSFANGVLYRHTGKVKKASLYLRNYAASKLPLFRVIVLTGPYTASTGELIVIALKGMPNVTIAGLPTYGVPTGVGTVTLKDGAMISLASSVPHGRDGTGYTSAILPEVKFELLGPNNLETYRALIELKR